MLKKEELVNYSYIINGRDNIGFQTSGTGSIVKHNKQYYLVTNFHVLTAKDANTNKKFPELRDTNLAVTLIFQPLDRHSNFIVIEYPLFNSEGIKNFETYMFQDQIIDVSVMPILLPENVIKFCFEMEDIYSSRTYDGNDHLMILGFPNGKFLNGWQPTKLDAISIKNSEFGPNIFDPYVFLDTSPTKGMSGSPIYIYNSTGEIKVIAIASNEVDNNSNALNKTIIKGRSVNFLYAIDLIKKMSSKNFASIKGNVYKNK